jgi:GTPase SAR1 family protein
MPNEGKKIPPALILIGMAGSGKTTLMQVCNNNQFIISYSPIARNLVDNIALECLSTFQKSTAIHVES